MKKSPTILILTDSATHAGHESIYGLVQALIAHRGVGDVFICDRNDEDNRPFFRDRLNVTGLHVFLADEWYGYETRHAHMTEYKDAGDFDAVWLLLDQPVSAEFLSYLSQVFAHAFIMNNPKGLIETSSKAMLLKLRREIEAVTLYLPPVKLCRSVEDVEVFRAKTGDIVLKPLHGYGGAGVKRYADGGTDLKNPADIYRYLDSYGMECLAMKLLHNTDQSDKRILVFDGRIIGSLLRRPAAGGWLCNLSSGGQAELSSPNIDEKALIDAIDPWLKRRGIYFYGIDTLKDENGKRMLSEINTLNAGGLKVLEDLSGEALSPLIAEGFCKLLDLYGARPLASAVEASGFSADLG